MNLSNNIIYSNRKSVCYMYDPDEDMLQTTYMIVSSMSYGRQRLLGEPLLH